MAKAKLTERGNVQVTMTPMQYAAITRILDFVRLGDRNAPTTAISNFCIDLENFNAEFGFGLDDEDVIVAFSRETRSGAVKELDDVTIELYMEDEDEE